MEIEKVEFHISTEPLFNVLVLGNMPQSQIKKKGLSKIGVLFFEKMIKYEISFLQKKGDFVF